MLAKVSKSRQTQLTLNFMPWSIVFVIYFFKYKYKIFLGYILLLLLVNIYVTNLSERDILENVDVIYVLLCFFFVRVKNLNYISKWYNTNIFIASQVSYSMIVVIACLWFHCQQIIEMRNVCTRKKRHEGEEDMLILFITVVLHVNIVQIYL